jgi:serine/threonine protein phosphatase PrpC
MNYNVEWVYEKGVRDINEDDYIIDNNEGLFAVIDGATGLGGLPGTLAAKTIKDSLIDTSPVNSLLDRTLQANQILGQKVKELANVDSLDVIPKEIRSSCGIAAIKINLEMARLDYVQAGDCMLFLQLENDDIRMVTYDYLSELDSKAISKLHLFIQEASINGEITEETLIAARKEIQDILVKNRKKLNSINGYPILDGSSSVVHFMESGTVSLNRVKKILLLSDGLQWPVQKAGGQQSWLTTAQLTFEKGLHYLLNEVVQLEDQDPYCLKYPRLKKADDKTGILINLKKE